VQAEALDPATLAAIIGAAVEDVGDPAIIAPSSGSRQPSGAL